jgi:hypothetical protein
MKSWQSQSRIMLARKQGVRCNNVLGKIVEDDLWKIKKDSQIHSDTMVNILKELSPYQERFPKGIPP